MKKLKLYLAVILLMKIILLPIVSVNAATTKLPSGILYNELETKIEEFVSEHEDTTAGMEVSIFNQNETIYSNYFGYADKEEKIVVDQDTVMEWGSATKMLVWVSIMQLWEQGKINLDNDIKEYLPEKFLTNLKYDTPITMINLMNHNAGFQEVYSDLFIKDYNSIQTLKDTLKSHEPAQIFEPGTITAYSNWGVALAAYIVEQISGENFDDYVHQHIFEPLNMKHSALSVDLGDNTWVQEKRKELQCYNIDGTLISDCFYYITLYPAGMCTSTLEDFEIFGKALLDKNSPLFKETKTWETFFTPTAYLGDSNIPSNYHGLWVLAYGVETIGHGGNTAGCSSYLLLDLKNEIGVVVMTNQSNEVIYNNEMMELIFGKFSEQDYLGTNRNVPEGIYRPARTVRRGPFKILSLSFESGDTAKFDQFWMTSINNGIEKICYPYEDYIRIPVWQFVLEMVLFFLLIAIPLFSIISLLIKIFRMMTYAYRKKTNIIPLGIWSTIAAFVQLITFLLFIIGLIKLSIYALSSSYIWIFMTFNIMIIIITALIIYGTMMLRKTNSTKKRKFYNRVTLILLKITILNIGYWNLFMFWEI